MAGASGFPRHWVYGDDGALIAKSGARRLQGVGRHAFGERTPWGDEDSPALVTAGRDGARAGAVDVDHAGRREAEDPQADGGREARRAGRRRATSCSCCSNGVLVVEVDGEAVAELGPGAVFGERAVLEGGRPHRDPARRHRLQGRVRVAADHIDTERAARRSPTGHRREERSPC